MSFSELLRLRVREANEKFALFSENERVLVGFSGGADSLVLLCVMHELLGENVYAFHVNHMLRGDQADGDELFCRRFCAERGIPFACARIDVATLSRGKAVEETARNARYEALLSECERVGAAKIALAHTASDNTETVIFNLSRGSALAGLRGIPPKRPHGSAEIIRPLILCTREEIEGYARENALDFCTDATNSDVHYSRNFIRHRIVPLVRELNPSVHKRVSAMCARLRNDEDFISGEARRFTEENITEKGIQLQKLSTLHPAVRTRVFAYMYSEICEESLEEKHFSDIDALVSGGRNGARIILPGKTAAIVKNGALLFEKEEVYAKTLEKSTFSAEIPVGISKFEKGFAVLLAKRSEAEKEISFLMNGAKFSSRVLLTQKQAEKVYIRNRENGDKYTFGGMTRTLKKLLSGAGESAKTLRPVFCDEVGIFWFPPFRLRDDVYASEDEKNYVLHYFEY